MRTAADKNKERLKYKKSLEQLTKRVRFTIIKIDKLMKKYPEVSKSATGSELAKILNPLDFDNDAALHFALGISFKSPTWKKLHPVDKNEP
jgi:hypothetical protein